MMQDPSAPDWPGGVAPLPAGATGQPPKPKPKKQPATMRGMLDALQASIAAAPKRGPGDSYS